MESTGTPSPPQSPGFPRTKPGSLIRYFCNRVDLQGLRSATQYYYRVFLDGADALPSTSQRELQFRTAPPDGPFRFLVLGDSGDGALEQTDVASRMFSELADFVLHTGDLAYDSGTF